MTSYQQSEAMINKGNVEFMLCRQHLCFHISDDENFAREGMHRASEIRDIFICGVRRLCSPLQLCSHIMREQKLK